MGLSERILAALGLGIVFGLGLNQGFPDAIAPINQFFLAPTGQAFLRLIQFVVVPIVFSSLVLGLTQIKDAEQIKRYLLKIMSSYALTSAIAVFLGMVIEQALQPGAGMAGFSHVATPTATQSPSILAWLVSLIPINPLEALSTGNLLQTIIAAALISIGIQAVGEKAASFVAFVESIYVIFEKILLLILYVAPLGVFALISSVIATQGLDIITKLLLYVAGVILAFVVMAVIYILILLGLKANPIKFFQSFFPAIFLSFGTASSNAALPIALQNAETYGLSPEIISFAIPLGTALKRDGTAVFQGFNALFIAQIYQIPITPNLVMVIAFSSFLISFSSAGVPGGGIISMATVLAAAGLPLEGIAIVAGVDRIIDGFKAVLNLIGNVVNAVLLSRWEALPIGAIAAAAPSEDLEPVGQQNSP